MIDISAELEDRELINALSRLRRKISNMRPAMAEIAETLRSSVEENFARESSRGPLVASKAKAGAWAALAPSTLKSRARKGKTGKKLQVTGQLLASIQTKSSDVEALVGTNKKYARFLNDGTKKMPARPFMVIQQADLREIEQTINEYFSEV
jgi:phage virion morphogenesis protein